MISLSLMARKHLSKFEKVQIVVYNEVSLKFMAIIKKKIVQLFLRHFTLINYKLNSIKDTIKIIRIFTM